ncbi:hypothetical protein SSX86_005940 [Deinandra increscens subsp. villosa]|uniref:TIR domain-containing protein n=1 Tax=Deinandra increscens subsp. villosa TaxID=3103831 RepID=A0AAP0DUW8_9ASTR
MAFSSIQKNFKYDVFLSFRGEDTRKNFVDHLYHALKQRGINTYKDDEEIKKGKRITDELIRSIEDSKFYIIVFSKNYASSSWCLDELVKIMECQNMIEHTAYPLFYDVEPTEVRKQSGAVGDAFAEHVNEEAAGRWRDALKEAADLAGRELKNTFDGHEAKFIQKVVEDISLELHFIDLSIHEKLVGMETRVKDVVTSLETDINDVRMIGIKGIGGGGKTTLARVVFDRISIMFEGSSFIEDVRENSKGSMGGLKSLKKQILSDVLHDRDIAIKGVSDFKKMMCARKVLVVLDDVDHINQLEALAGELNWFKPGSRIIITTRDEQVLVAHGVPKNLILNVNLLSPGEATFLFNNYAFGRAIPNQRYEMLSNQVVCYAGGLPLTIKVLGSFLSGKDELEWTDALERLKTIPLKETLEILELSYESLEKEYKEIFLDVACILKGWDKEEAMRALECRGFHARIGLKVLELKSLITVSESGRLGMHDHIEELGKNIIRRLHPEDPSRHSRLWNHDEIEDILVEDKGTEETRCIKLRWVDPVIFMKGLRKMEELRFLDVIYFYNIDYRDIGEDSLYLPNRLQYLRWDGYPFKYLPNNFQAYNLVGLTMHFGNIDQLWKVGERKVLKKLRFIDLFSCKLRSLDIGLMPNLERLNLVSCYTLVEFHTTVKNSNLKYLNISKSPLRTLDLEWAQNLDTLKVDQESMNCMTQLCMPVKSLKLKHLTIHCSNLNTLNIMRFVNLETLDLECNGFVELHFPIEKLKRLRLIRSSMKTINLSGTRNLEALDLTSCKDLLELQMPLESPELKTIGLTCSKLRTLNLTGAHNLKVLDLKQCEDLVELQMPIENPKVKIINIRCSKLRTLNLTRCWNLESLELEQCEDLVELQMPIESHELKSINIRCFKLRTLKLMGSRNLERLDLVQCEDLVELHIPNESPNLKAINIPCSKLRILNLTGSRNLERLDIRQCEDLVELHMPIESPNLKAIIIPCSKLRTLNLKGCQNLERIYLEQCEMLVDLHMPIESPELKCIYISYSKLRTLNLTGSWNLERLDLEQCKDLVELQMPIKSPLLKSISIRCSKLSTFNMGRSPYLECLYLHDCFNLVEIHVLVGYLSGSVRFKPFLVNQGLPMVGSFDDLHLIARSLAICSLHPDNNLPKFHFECIYKELLLSSTRNLAELITNFGFCACSNLASLSRIICGLQHLRKLTLEGDIPEVPKELDKLECLQELTLLSTNIEHLPDSICMLKHLKLLRLKSCWFLKQLPEDLGRLECLEELYLTDCTSLRDIPNSICEMKLLVCFHLTNCILVERLPKGIGRLKCLKELNIQGTGISDIPESIFELEDLRFIL